MNALLGKLLGRPLANSEESENKIGAFAGVPTLGLDALGSASYGPEAALAILIPVGAAGLRYIGPVSGVILALLAILYFSYRQTISAYPKGGGSYTVARENLGPRAGLLAASALMLDYILNVAVGISAGVGALVSAVPSLHPHILALCLGVLVVLTIINLRGVREPGAILSVPTYLFVGSLLCVVAVGAFRTVTFGGHPPPVTAPPALPKATEAISVWLLLRAFASGCTAMTGVEAVSNGVTIFADPAVKRAERTLTAIVLILAILLAGIAFLCHSYAIGAMDQEKAGYQSVISQLVGAVVGRGWIYDVTLGSVLAVLALSANTSFAGFPRLCSILATDGYLPRVLGEMGRRLVYSSGIFALAALAGVLLVVFGGITDRLIPLFAVGAFGAFTASQAGMVVHWRRNRGERRAGTSLAINAAGAVATAAALAVIIVAKFVEGAWLTLLLIPAALLVFSRVHRHYKHVAESIRCPRAFDPASLSAPLVIVPIEGWNRLTEEALRFGMRLSADVVAIHVNRRGSEAPSPEIERAADPCELWQREIETPAVRAGLKPPRLEIVNSPYRLLFEPLLDCIKRLRDEEPPTRLLTVIVPSLMTNHWYERLLHNDRAAGLRRELIAMGDRRVVVVNMPWYLTDQPVETGHPISSSVTGSLFASARPGTPPAA